MKEQLKIGLAVVMGVCGGGLLADPFGAPPDARHAWAVHDDNRPGVKKITALPGGVPSDAKVLFDGSAESIERNWCDASGKPTRWTIDEQGELISVRGAGYIFTKDKFADFQLHVEWASPKKVEGMNQGRGNSGVFLMGNYEIQVLDSYETDPDAPGGNKNPNYSDGQAGAVYGQNPPLVNPCRAPGEFNSYDIIFHAPILDAQGGVVRPATVTVLFNGVVVQDHWLFDGPTGWRNRATYARTTADTGLKREEKMPIAFQDHGNPVHYRNVWIRELPRPEDNVTHGTYYAKVDKVMELRRATADKLDAEFDAKWGQEKLGRKMVEAWRVASYAATPERLARVQKLEADYLAAVKDMTRRDEVNALGIDHWNLNFYYNGLLSAGVITEDNAVLKKLRELK